MAEYSPPQNPSRYISQRQQQSSPEDHSPESDQPSSSPPGDAVSRSKSRYRRKQGSSASSPPETRPASQQQPQQQSEPPTRYHSTKQRNLPLKPLYQQKLVEAPRQPRQTSSSNVRDRTVQTESGVQDPGAFSSGSDRPNGPQMTSPLVDGAPPPIGELFPPPKPIEQPVRRNGPPQSGQIRATKSMSQLPTLGDEDQGCFGGMFKRRRAVAGDVKGSGASPRTAKEKFEPNIAKPGFDAPVSAVNTGDRQVMVECGESKRLFLVTPTTTPSDIIKSAATCMSVRVSPQSAVLLEYFATVGVQRPLRRYEHIRDVLNSWDNDRQNSLLLVDPGTGNLEAELTIVGVPKVKPADESWPLSYSQKPGKWEKRFITLRSDGQIICQKDPSKPKDTYNVCHMSDFDIYTPTPDKMRKKIKPPKKLCFAIKSQQKTAMFESTNDFVHFFSTGDKVIGDHFYSAIQEWRSWYLVHVRGEGYTEPPVIAHAPALNSSEFRDRATSNDQSYANHRSKQSMDSHYQLGSFKPAFDMDQFDTTLRTSDPRRDPVSSSGFTSSGALERRTSNAKRQRATPPILNKPVLADDEPLANLNRVSSVSRRRRSSEQRGADDYDTRIAGNGSSDGLQRQSSTRKYGSNNDMRRSGSAREQSRGHARSNSHDLDRSNSRRQNMNTKPLVDLTPTFKEAPQHVNKGRGFKPAAIGAGGLIESATSPEDPLNIAQQTVFRNTSNPQHVSSGPHSPGLVDLKPQQKEPSHHTRKGRGYAPENSGSSSGLLTTASTCESSLGISQETESRNRTAVPEGRRPAGSGSETQQAPRRQGSVKRSPEAFTGEGLLGSAANRQGWGSGNKGRGVIDGSRAGGKPLVDLTGTSAFTQGSLLNTVEKAQGIPAPIIDRKRRDD